MIHQWKKALLDITGHACMEAFYAEFDVWAGSATEASVLAILEAQCDVDAATEGYRAAIATKSASDAATVAVAVNNLLTIVGPRGVGGAEAIKKMEKLRRVHVCRAGPHTTAFAR